MEYQEIENIFSKLKRLHKQSQRLNGEGTSWSINFPNNENCKYIIKKFRDFESIQDDIENYLIWLWNLKDYFKSISNDKQLVEKYVNNNYHLTILADIANSLKHSKLNNSRSGVFPILGKLTVTLDQKNMSQITFYANEVELEPKDVNAAELTLPIIDKNGNNLIDLFDLLKFVEEKWVNFASSIKVV